jgi:alkanesulfonate monooxygenase SsuD/methylene tetrahydromethanopterin reductase-like flavin-dependent oxidoreductase (luciferase family)
VRRSQRGVHTSDLGDVVGRDLTLPRFHDPGERQPYRRTFDFCRTVDELGYAGGFIGHHSLSPEVKDEAAPFVFLSAIGVHTERMRLGTGVYLAGLHHPANIIEQVSTLDRVTNGRAVLDVGTGYREYEFKTYGTDYARRGKRLDETLAVVRKAWESGSYEWNGEFFHFDEQSRNIK